MIPQEHTPADPVLLARRLDRERRARLESERLLEAKSRELHLANQDLAQLNTRLEARVAERTHELEVARQDAVKASAAKSEFFAHMSHEIRTPLNGVIGAAALLRNDLTHPQHLTLIDTVTSSADILLALVNDVLDFERIESGRLEFFPAPFDLPSVIARCGELFGPSARAKGLELVLSCRLPDSLLVVGDTLRLQQVLVNLVGNAVKFTRTGKVTLTVEPQPRNPGESSRYQFSVADTGPGLDVEQQARLFQPYSQAGRNPADRIGGSGLGLVTCERLVTLAGGKLELQSRPGIGSVFTFTLPLPEALIAGHHAAPSALSIPKDVNSLRIVIADDVKTNVDVLNLILCRMGHTVTPYLSGLEAIEHVQNKPADLVFLDLHMPTVDGFEAARRIRAIPNVGARIGLIAFTADAQVETNDACLAVGFDACLHKPIRPTLVKETIARVYAKRSV